MKQLLMILAIVSISAQAEPNIVQVGSYQIHDDGQTVSVHQVGTPTSLYNGPGLSNNTLAQSNNTNFTGMSIIRAPQASYLVQRSGSTTTVIQTSKGR